MTERNAPLVTPARIVAAVCVIVPFIAVLWVPLYNKDTPELGGFPFFFWWQLLWVAITAALMGLAYFVIRREELARRAVIGAPGIDPAVSARVEEAVVEGKPTAGVAGTETGADAVGETGADPDGDSDSDTDKGAGE